MSRPTDDNISNDNPEDDNYDDTETETIPEPSDDIEQPVEGLFGASAQTYKIIIQALAYYPRRSHVYVTSTTGGGHATSSYHYRGQAIDIGSASQSEKDALAAWLYKFSSHLTELIHARAGAKSGWFVKNGVKRSVTYYGSTTVKNHVNHCHLAIATVAQANAFLAAARASANPNAFPGVLSLGSTGSAVKKLQTALKLTADGDFGKKTEAAVKAYQKAHKLTADGIVGKLTWGSIF